MKKIWKILIIAAVVLGICAATCPSKERHCAAINNVMRKSLHEQAEKLIADFEKDFGKDDETRQKIVSMEEELMKQLEPAINQAIEIKNCLFFNLGQMANETDGTTTVSFGFLGMVHANKKDLKTNYNYNNSSSSSN